LPLRSCEVRTLTLDGADMVVQANADDSVASIVVVHASDDEARARAYQKARAIFGDPHPDTRTQVRAFKDGLTQLTDNCGRPVMPSPSPT
jgi:biotin carboxylase